ncbi:MAG: hypothetical protein WC370_07510 [Dehalococcoidales bacterium]|jgi:hypothetical protein
MKKAVNRERVSVIAIVSLAVMAMSVLQPILSPGCSAHRAFCCIVRANSIEFAL